MKIALFALLLLGLVGVAGAKPWWLRGVETNESAFLDPNVAFRVGARVDGGDIHVRWVIADGYYLYRQKIEIKAESPDLILSRADLPPGTVKTDPYLGRQEIYQRQVDARVAYSRLDGGAHPLQVKVTYQGCAEAGLCYPPITRVLSPVQSTSITTSAPHHWEGIAILGGAAAFLLAGLWLRKGRELELPAA